jgi:hypothetical protein
VDPSQGVVKWSAQRAHQHLQAVVTAAVGIPLAATVAGLFLALPAHPTVEERIGQAAEALGIGLLLVAVLAFLYAILLAPYEQRKELRSELLAVRTKYGELVDSVHKGLVLSEASVNREVRPENPLQTVRLNFHLRLRNDTDTVIEYQMKELSVYVRDQKVKLPDDDASYRIWPKSDNGYLFYVPVDPPLIGGFETTFEYVAWYGPITATDAYEQHYAYRIRDNASLDPSRYNGRYWREAGGHDVSRAVPSGH